MSNETEQPTPPFGAAHGYAWIREEIQRRRRSELTHRHFLQTHEEYEQRGWQDALRWVLEMVEKHNIVLDAATIEGSQHK
jgi:hypothetical protein